MTVNLMLTAALTTIVTLVNTVNLTKVIVLAQIALSVIIVPSAIIVSLLNIKALVNAVVLVKTVVLIKIHILKILKIDRIGSRAGCTYFFKTTNIMYVRCGCFFGTVIEFEEKVKQTHAYNEQYLNEYMKTIEYVKAIM